MKLNIHSDIVDKLDCFIKNKQIPNLIFHNQMVGKQH